MKVWLCNSIDLFPCSKYDYPILVIKSNNIKKVSKIKKKFKCGFIKYNKEKSFVYYIVIQRSCLLKWIHFFGSQRVNPLVNLYNQTFQVKLKC